MRMGSQRGCLFEITAKLGEREREREREAGVEDSYIPFMTVFSSNFVTGKINVLICNMHVCTTSCLIPNHKFYVSFLDVVITENS